MSTKAKIKVIKRGDQPPRKVVKSLRKQAQTAKHSAREMVATVTGWVDELQKKRRENAKEAFDKLLVKASDPTTCTN